VVVVWGLHSLELLSEASVVGELIPGRLYGSRRWWPASLCLWYAPLPAARDAKVTGPNLDWAVV
jgi:hypothetical protein